MRSRSKGSLIVLLILMAIVLRPFHLAPQQQSSHRGLRPFSATTTEALRPGSVPSHLKRNAPRLDSIRRIGSTRTFTIDPVSASVELRPIPGGFCHPPSNSGIYRPPS